MKMRSGEPTLGSFYYLPLFVVLPCPWFVVLQVKLGRFRRCPTQDQATFPLDPVTPTAHAGPKQHKLISDRNETLFDKT
jgi:hypothetical protein